MGAGDFSFARELVPRSSKVEASLVMEVGFQCAKVLGIQVLLYLVVPAWMLSRFRWRDASECAFASLVAGVASAALWGWVCNLGGIGIAWATAIWLAGWVGAGIWIRKKRPALPTLSWDFVCCAILLLALVVRVIHPFQTWALGQSDAYSHLGFLRDVLEQGRVGNAEYPPAYSWVLAIPTWLSRVHPFEMARFGGAFFGAGLVLGMYVLMTPLGGRLAGRTAAALVAGCPVFILLQKTGVGCFANQLGLLLIPAALWAFTTGRRGWLAMALAALAVSVPMMLLHVLLLLVVLTVCDRARMKHGWAWLGVFVLAGFALLGVAIVIPSERVRVIAAMLTGQHELVAQSGPQWSDLWWVLAKDYFAIKRWGYPSWVLNAGASATALCFAWGFAHGWKKQSAAWRVIGAWGLLTSIHVHLGLFQFTNYQREGWSLLLATAGFAALILDALWRKWENPRVRNGLYLCVICVSLAGLVFPPVHEVPAGPAESDVVRFVLSLDSETTVLTRPTGFMSGQGDVVRSLHPKVLSDVAEISAVSGPVLFLRDRPQVHSRVSTIMKILQPKLTAESEKAHAHAEEQNLYLEAQLEDYNLQKAEFSQHLEVWHILPEK